VKTSSNNIYNTNNRNDPKFCKYVNPIRLAENEDQRPAFTNTALDIFLQQEADNFLSCLVMISVQKKTLLHGAPFIFLKRTIQTFQIGACNVLYDNFLSGDLNSVVLQKEKVIVKITFVLVTLGNITIRSWLRSK
jgi:hypothetical protein